MYVNIFYFRRGEGMSMKKLSRAEAKNVKAGWWYCGVFVLGCLVG
jgi:hypothetical protein